MLQNFALAFNEIWYMKMMKDDINEKISPEKAKQLLHEDGFEVTIDQAVMILDFFYLMSEIVVDQYLNTNDSL